MKKKDLSDILQHLIGSIQKENERSPSSFLQTLLSDYYQKLNSSNRGGQLLVRSASFSGVTKRKVMMRDASSDFQEHKSRKVSQFEEDPSNPFHQLPSEIIEMIFSFLFEEWASLSLVSKQWYSIINDLLKQRPNAVIQVDSRIFEKSVDVILSKHGHPTRIIVDLVHNTRKHFLSAIESLKNVTTFEVVDRETHPEDPFFPGIGKHIALPLLYQLPEGLESFMYKPSDLSLDIVKSLTRFKNLSYLNYSVPYQWTDIIESTFDLHKSITRLKIYDARLKDRSLVHLNHLRKLGESLVNLKRLSLYFVVEGCEHILPYMSSRQLEYAQIIQTYEADVLDEEILIEFFSIHTNLRKLSINGNWQGDERELSDRFWQQISNIETLTLGCSLAPVFVRHCQAISKHCQSLQSLSLRVQDESVAMDELDNDVLQNLFQCCPKLNQVIYKYTKYTRGNLPEVQFTKRQTRIDPSKISVEIVGN